MRLYLFLVHIWQERQTKEVVMGKLSACTSFGEISILKDEPITCSIVTATPVTLATIEPSKLSGKALTSIFIRDDPAILSDFQN
jgi:CRP-like cAMP-binding protein